MAKRVLLCPNCGAPLHGVKRWFGLARRLPSHCPNCGARLLYDKVGGVYAAPTPEPGQPPEAEGRDK